MPVRKPYRRRRPLQAPTTTTVVLRVTGRQGEPWWVSLGLPPPYQWGDDHNHVYVIRAVSDGAVGHRAADMRGVAA